MKPGYSEFWLVTDNKMKTSWNFFGHRIIWVWFYLRPRGNINMTKLMDSNTFSHTAKEEKGKVT
jgi:hypothetical protein